MEETNRLAMPFLIIFVLIPIAEVYAFIVIGEEIGILKTLLLCVLTAVIGGFLVRQQGLETMMKAQRSFQGGVLPLDSLFDGFCLIVAGALLLTPGFVTDIVGFTLLMPTLRRFYRSILIKYGRFNIDVQARKSSKNDENGDIIEGNYEEIDKNNKKID